MPATGCRPASTGAHGARTSPPGRRPRSRRSTPGWPAPGTAPRCSASFTVHRSRRRQAPTAPSTGRWTSLASGLGPPGVTARGYPRQGCRGSCAVRRPGHVAIGALHVWGWNGESVGIGGVAVRRLRAQPLDRPGRAGRAWHDSPISYGELGRLTLELPGGGRRPVPAVQLDPFGAAVWLSDTPRGDEPLAVARLVRRAHPFRRPVVGSGRGVAPEVRRRGPFHRGPLAPGAHRRAPRRARACRRRRTGDLPQRLERRHRRDRRARWSTGWRGPCCTTADGSPTWVASAHPTCRRSGRCSPPSPSPIRWCASGDDGFDEALIDLAQTLDRHRRRLDGEPVVRGRVRLTLPDDALDPWLVELELVDDADPGKWCTADDVWERAPRALDVAGGERRLARPRAGGARRWRRRRAAASPGWRELAAEHEPSLVELDLEQADDFIDCAPAELGQAGHRAARPGAARAHVKRRRARHGARVAGRRPQGPVRQGGAASSGQAVIDEHAAVRGRSGPRRGCRHDAAALRAPLGAHRPGRPAPGADAARRRTSPSVRASAPVELLRLSAGAAATARRTHRDRHRRPTADARTAGTAPPAGSRSCSPGCPTNASRRLVESPRFHGELRHYQRRGLAWMQFLARVGLGGCLADDMGLGKTATTLAHLLERPGPHLVVCPLERRPQLGGRDAPLHARPARRRAPWLRPPARRAGAVRSRRRRRRRHHLRAAAARPRRRCGESQWSTVVLDEAQMIKNAGTKAAKAVRRLRAGQKLALTGTPVENRLSELWAILDAVNPGLLGSQHALPRAVRGGDRAQRRPRRSAARLRTLTQPFVLRRTKADRRLLPDLPDKIEQTRLRPAHPRAGDPLPAGRRPAAGRRQGSRGYAAPRAACWRR